MFSGSVSPTTDLRPLMIDIDNLGGSTFVRQDDVNLDLHSNAQWDGARDQCSMAVERLATTTNLRY